MGGRVHVCHFRLPDPWLLSTVSLHHTREKQFTPDLPRNRAVKAAVPAGDAVLRPGQQQLRLLFYRAGNLG